MQKDLSHLGETGAIRMVHDYFPDRPDYVKKGIGDDCAVLETGGKDLLLVTTDMLVEGIHFVSDRVSFEDLGWKALAVNLSDIAAMGGVPDTALLSIGLKPSAPASDLDAFMRGFSQMASKAGVFLAGGDTVRVRSDLVISVTLLGRCSQEALVLRSGARVNDDVWVSGFLGDAAGGLEILLDKEYGNEKVSERLIRSHLRPLPRLRLGRALGEKGLAHAMIDLSDGVARDLRHICDESDVGAVVDRESIPISDALCILGQNLDHDPFDWALNGGEDYELLFTASPQLRKDIEKTSTDITGESAVRIGSVVKERGLWIGSESSRTELRDAGYSHF